MSGPVTIEPLGSDTPQLRRVHAASDRPPERRGRVLPMNLTNVPGVAALAVAGVISTSCSSGTAQVDGVGSEQTSTPSEQSVVSSADFFEKLSSLAFANAKLDWGVLQSLESVGADGSVVAGVVQRVTDGGTGPWIVGAGPSTGQDERRLEVVLRHDDGSESVLLLPAGTRPPEGSAAPWPSSLDEILEAAPIGDHWIAITFPVEDGTAAATLIAADTRGAAVSFGAPIAEGTTFVDLLAEHTGAAGTAGG